MDLSPATTLPSPHRASLWLRVLLLTGFVLYAAFLLRHLNACAGGSDTSGYLNSARLLATGQTTTPQAIPVGIDPEKFDWFTFIPLGFRPVPLGRMAPTYPIGLPLAVAAVAPAIGWRLAPNLVMLLSALATVALMLPLGRAAGLPLAWSAFGALILAASPLTSFMSVQLMSDIPATAATVMTFLCAWRSRTCRPWALLAGAVFALTVLIRPNSLILLLPLALCLGTDWRRWLLFSLGGLPGAVLQIGYNLSAYHDPLASGYGGDLATKFTFAIIPTTLAHYAHWLPTLLTPAGLFVVALPWLARRDRFAWVLITWIVVSVAFYAAYWHTHETWWYLRFLLPAFPAAIIGGLWVLRLAWNHFATARLQSVRVTRCLVAGAVGAVLLHSDFWHGRLNAALIGKGESVYLETFAWVRAHLPPDAILAAHQTSGALRYYTGFQLVRWDRLTPSRFALLVDAATASHRPIYAVLFPHEVAEAFKENMPGSWLQIGAVRHVSIWQWSP